MIISHARQFIFIKTAKTAGTSLEIALSRYCGPKDVITPITPEDEAIRRRLGFRGPQNFRKSPLAAQREDIKRLLFQRQVLMKFYNHMPAAAAKAALPDALWRDYFTFTVCRNPWSRMLSTYRWNARNIASVRRQSFHEFLFENPQRVSLNWRLYTERDQILVDDVVKFEEMEAGLARVSERIGLPGDLAEEMRAIRAKDGGGGAPRAPIHWREDDVALIGLLAAPEIARFGYAPPQIGAPS